jgi:UDP-galactopyranose mutase
VNYTDANTPYTRIIEHKHFEFGQQAHTVITHEYSKTWSVGEEPFYPINDDVNQAVFRKYEALAKTQENVLFGGRLGEYRYYDMHQVIGSALQKAKSEIS